MIWYFKSIGYEDFSLMKYNTVQSVESKLMFRKKMLPLSIRMNNKWSKKPAWKNRKTEAICFAETLVEFQQTTPRCTPENKNFQNVELFQILKWFNTFFNDLDRIAGKKY
jgi:hypothetical protein